MTGFRSESESLSRAVHDRRFTAAFNRVCRANAKTQDMRAQRGHSRARIAPAFFLQEKGILCVRQGGRAKSRIGRIRAIGSVRPSRRKRGFGRII